MDELSGHEHKKVIQALHDLPHHLTLHFKEEGEGKESIPISKSICHPTTGLMYTCTDELVERESDAYEIRNYFSSIIDLKKGKQEAGDAVMDFLCGFVRPRILGYVSICDCFAPPYPGCTIPAFVSHHEGIYLVLKCPVVHIDINVETRGLIPKIISNPVVDIAYKSRDRVDWKNPPTMKGEWRNQVVRLGIYQHQEEGGGWEIMTRGMRDIVEFEKREMEKREAEKRGKEKT